MTPFEPVIGIEVHAQIKTASKLFCACSTQFGHDPNANTCPICIGFPGALPVLNRNAVELAIRAGLALGCTLNPVSVFARKNYFYPDLPKGYQISQFDQPLCSNGLLEIQANGETRRIRINRIHMEEDAGKLVHHGSATIAGSTHSLVDLNRSSTPLIEIVSEPDIRSAEEARLYMEALKSILQHMGVCDGNLEEGSLRADANVSIRPAGATELGTKTELKNMNSFRALERGILVEIERQIQLVNSGERVRQQTRTYDDASQTTKLLRDKEESHDYRYFPEPDLLPLRVSAAWVDTVRASMPELPEAKRKRYLETHHLSAGDADILLADLDMAAYFEACVTQKSGVPAAEVARFVVGDLNALVKQEKIPFTKNPVTPEKLIALLALKEKGTVSIKMAKDFLVDMFKTGKAAAELLDAGGGSQISDESELIAIIDKLLAENPDIVEKVKAGKAQSANFIMGQVMKATQGRAKPDLVRELVLKQISTR
ncbi:MAG: Asp-tRNA(Asn)/Glu-tRNA(Gln) amidotransferase subunit GatB [Candidatus Margulisiibacteriota bacterium]